MGHHTTTHSHTHECAYVSFRVLCLQGEGIARQRKAIVDGLRESVHDFSKNISGMGAKDVLDLVLITQYFDTLKVRRPAGNHHTTHIATVGVRHPCVYVCVCGQDLGAQSGHQTIFIPHNPGSLGALAEEIRGGVVGKAKK